MKITYDLLQDGSFVIFMDGKFRYTMDFDEQSKYWILRNEHGVYKMSFHHQHMINANISIDIVEAFIKNEN